MFPEIAPETMECTLELLAVGQSTHVRKKAKTRNMGSLEACTPVSPVTLASKQFLKMGQDHVPGINSLLLSHLNNVLTRSVLDPGFAAVTRCLLYQGQGPRLRLWEEALDQDFFGCIHTCIQ